MSVSIKMFAAVLTTFCTVNSYSQSFPDSIKWTGFKIEDKDTVRMELVLERRNSIISGKATYFFSNGKYYKTFTVEGKVSNDSIVISDGFIQDKLMPPFDCSFYGDYYLKMDSVTLTGVWKEPYKSIVRKLEMGDIYLVKEGAPGSNYNFDSLLLKRIADERMDTIIQAFKTKFRTVELSVSDDAVVDNDIISILFNENVLIKNYSLTAKPLKFTLDIDSARKKSYLRFIAENVGNIPPNTATIKIKIGEVVRSLIIPSSFKYNGVIVFELSDE
jgi:hypothetical protein